MHNDCVNFKTQLEDLMGKGLSDKAKLVAILEACGVTDREEVERLLECKPSTLREAKSALKFQRQKSSAAGNPAPEIQHNAGNPAQTLEIQRQKSSDPSCAGANTESLRDKYYLEGKKEPPTPNDELHRIARELGETIKDGKVAKSGRAQNRTVGELDGTFGIKLANGKLTITGEPAAELRADYPSIDLPAVAARACPELMRSNYPTADMAIAVIRKWAAIAGTSSTSSHPKQAPVDGVRPDGKPTLAAALAARIAKREAAERVAA